MAASGALSGAHLGAGTLQRTELSEGRTLETQLSLPSRQRRESSQELPRLSHLPQPYKDGSSELLHSCRTCRDIPGSSLQAPTVLCAGKVGNASRGLHTRSDTPQKLSGSFWMSHADSAAESSAFSVPATTPLSKGREFCWRLQLAFGGATTVQRMPKDQLVEGSPCAEVPEVSVSTGLPSVLVRTSRCSVLVE